MRIAQRFWTEVGAELVERLGGRDAVAAEAARLDWQELPEDGNLTRRSAPRSASIKTAIRELGIPRVSAIAIGGIDRPSANPDDGFYPGLYGVEGNYDNGQAKVYILDVGTSLSPLFSDYYPKEGAK